LEIIASYNQQCFALSFALKKSNVAFSNSCFGFDFQMYNLESRLFVNVGNKVHFLNWFLIFVCLNSAQPLLTIPESVSNSSISPAVHSASLATSIDPDRVSRVASELMSSVIFESSKRGRLNPTVHQLSSDTHQAPALVDLKTHVVPIAVVPQSVGSSPSASPVPHLFVSMFDC
jgi:hypothetical protein